MVFCIKCGKELPEDAFFCLKCGVRTRKGIEAGVPRPWNWEQEVEKAFTTVAEEMKKAFETVKENIQKTAKRKPIICSNCGEKNLWSATFCYKCGEKIK